MNRIGDFDAPDCVGIAQQEVDWNTVHRNLELYDTCPACNVEMERLRAARRAKIWLIRFVIGVLLVGGALVLWVMR